MISQPSKAEMDSVGEIISRDEGKRTGSLRFFGCWFGRPYDNYHTIVGASFDADVLTLSFNEGETLTVWAPRGIQIASEPISRRSHPLFLVEQAAKVTWRWSAYGGAKSNESFIQLEYGFRNRKMYSSSSSARFIAGQPDPAENAVELI